MKYLFLILFTFNAWGDAVVDPEEARDAVTKAMFSEFWSLQVSNFVTDGRVVLDHPSSRRQIILDGVNITFFDIEEGQVTLSSSPLHATFIQDIVIAFGPPVISIEATLTDWVE